MPTPLTALDKLLVIRCLRSDRFERAMRMFVESEVGDLMEKSLPVFDEVLSGIKHSIPIFVVMPDHSSVNTPFKISPVESIRRIAEAHNVQCQQISVGHGQEEIIDVALATAVRTDTWLVIENLQTGFPPLARPALQSIVQASVTSGNVLGSITMARVPAL
ncbi:hypothetical protein OS493_010381 [Desmophyllum pertusum]|uniref:Uncharacterized protein n=1 Tax=Desmophyllum pertusum TaxID=174260 RepID=A0A9X0DBK5_9CNID|nr:hypothetical protein OS493_010381 [Desmophyllum pertusum]